LPVSIYDLPTSRRLAADNPANAISIGRSSQDITKIRSDEASSSIAVAVTENSSDNDAKTTKPEINSFFELSHQPFTEDMTRGEICAFIAGREDEATKWAVTMRSILQFEPGMRIAIAVEGDPQAYRR